MPRSMGGGAWIGESAWSDVPGTVFEINSQGDLVLRFYGSKLKLPPAVLPGGTRLDFSVNLDLPQLGIFEVYFAEWVNGVLMGGMSFSLVQTID